MFDNFRVVAVTPAGRQRYLDVLAPYILREQGLVDEWRLWLNTTVQEDIDYCRALEAQYPGFVRCVEPDPEVGVHEMRGYSIHQFFRDCTDPSTVYIRFDDDICWVAPDAVRELVRFRLERPDYFLVFANIVNNAVCSHLHLRLNAMGCAEGGRLASYDCCCPVGWGDPLFAEHVHNTFLEHLKDGREDEYKFRRWELFGGERFSINCFAFLGSEFAKFEGNVFYDEEWWLSHAKPMEIGRANVVLGTALVSHFAFSTQRDYLETTPLLERYRELSLVPGLSAQSITAEASNRRVKPAPEPVPVPTPDPVPAPPAPTPDPAPPPVRTEYVEPAFDPMQNFVVVVTQ